MTDRSTEHGTTGRVAVRSRLVIIACAASSLAFVFTCEGPDFPPPLECYDFSVRLRPGTCVAIENPCIGFGASWSTLTDGDIRDSFTLDLPPSVYLETQLGLHATAQSICATPESPTIVDQACDYTYRRKETVNWAEGHSQAHITVAPELLVTASAEPAVIESGDSSQLLASVSGGVPPYRYSWVDPTNTLSNPTSRNPVATPAASTSYTVTVTDAVTDGNGFHVRATSQPVLVTVISAGPPLTVTATATPSVIAVGDSSQLDANPSGGNGIYAYAWLPTTGLSDPTIRNPIATPAASTTYTVTVTDGNGVSTSSPVLVTVTGAGPPTAAFTFTRVACSATTPCSNGATTGQEVFLDGSTSTGSIVVVQVGTRLDGREPRYSERGTDD